MHFNHPLYSLAIVYKAEQQSLGDESKRLVGQRRPHSHVPNCSKSRLNLGVGSVGDYPKHNIQHPHLTSELVVREVEVAHLC